jgi:hypothetical protein
LDELDDRLTQDISSDIINTKIPGLHIEAALRIGRWIRDYPERIKGIRIRLGLTVHYTNHHGFDSDWRGADCCGFPSNKKLNREMLDKMEHVSTPRSGGNHPLLQVLVILKLATARILVYDTNRNTPDSFGEGVRSRSLRVGSCFFLGAFR